MLCCCSAYVLPLASVINHLFGEPQFARFAGTRTQALLDSAVYKRVDEAHGYAISALAEASVQDQSNPSGDAAGNPEPSQAGNIAGDSDASVTSDDDADVPMSDDQSDPLEEVGDPDPSDEVMTANGDVSAIMFALFVDGVQLHQSGSATTTVVSLKCLDLPGFLVNTDMASFNLAFIGGKKEPTCMTQFLDIILEKFKAAEPMGSLGPDGLFPPLHSTFLADV